MNLKEIKPSKEKPITKFKNFQEELSFIKKEKKDNKEKLTQQDIHEISRNIIKDKVIVKKFIEALLRFYESYYKSDAPFIDLEKHSKIIKLYKQKTSYSNTEKHLEAIGNNAYKNNQILQYIRLYKEKYNANGQEILTKILEYNGEPLREEIEVEIGPLALEFNFKSNKDLVTFVGHYGVTKPLHEGWISYNISTIYGTLANVIIYNEECIDNLVKINKDSFPNIPNFKEYLQKSTKLHEQQHALMTYLWKRFLASTSNKNKTEPIEAAEFYRFVQNTSGEILAFYQADFFTTRGIPTVLTKNYHKLYETLAKIYYKKQTLNDVLDPDIDMQNKIEAKSKQEIKKYADIAIRAIISLEQAGYNKKEIIYYLMDEPLTKWNLLAKRLIDNKDLSQTK